MGTWSSRNFSRWLCLVASRNVLYNELLAFRTSYNAKRQSHREKLFDHQCPLCESLCLCGKKTRPTGETHE